MRRANRYGMHAILTLLIVVLAGTVAGVFGQGRGHDRGGGPPPGRGGGGGQPQRQVFNPGPQRQMQMSRPAPQQMQRQMPRFERPQIARPQAQPRYAPAPMQRPMQRSMPPPNRGWQNRGWQVPERGRIEQPRPQQDRQYRMERRPDLGRAMPQQNRIERRSDLGRMMRQQNRAEQRPDLGRMMPQQNRMERRSDLGRMMRQQSSPEMRADRGNGRFDREMRRGDRGMFGQRPDRSSSLWNHAWPNNYGYQRSNEVHSRNADRFALREQENFWRDRERRFGRRFDERDFERAYFRHQDFRDDVLRSVIANVFIGGTDSYYYYPPQYYYDPYYYGVPYNPAYFDYGYYTPPDAYLYEPIYYSFPFGYAYFPQDYLYPADYYSYGAFPDYSYGYPDDFPLAYFTDSSLGNVYITQMYGDLLAYGYEQGYLDGVYASEHARYRDNYYDPFAFENTVYDPYSYTLGENRRCLSQGYEIGYQDALNGNDNQYDPYYVENNDDLVSLFIGTSLEM